MVGSLNAAFSDGLWLLSWGVMIVALVLTVVSMLDYIAKARHLIGLGHTMSREAREVEELEVLDMLAARVLEAARASGYTIGTAESLTGGLIAATLTDVAGSSDVVRGGVVSYAAAVKRDVLGVSGEVIDRFGVVSAETARAMAAGARRELACDAAVAVTGIAGPGGAEPDKPVGTVWIGISCGKRAEERVFLFEGSREEVRLATVRAAFELLLDACKDVRS